MTINVKAGDSPKIYALLRDIYGEPIGVGRDAITAFTYTVYKVVSGVRVPINGFVDVEIPSACYHIEPQPYPSNIAGLTTYEIASKYNVEVFPYQISNVDDDQVWTSPFTEPNATYELVTRLSYLMSDDALTGTATINKTFSVRVYCRGLE